MLSRASLCVSACEWWVPRTVVELTSSSAKVCLFSVVLLLLFLMVVCVSHLADRHWRITSPFTLLLTATSLLLQPFRRPFHAALLAKNIVLQHVLQLKGDNWFWFNHVLTCHLLQAAQPFRTAEQTLTSKLSQASVAVSLKVYSGNVPSSTITTPNVWPFYLPEKKLIKRKPKCQTEEWTSIILCQKIIFLKKPESTQKKML